jgi:hypothetical protein
MPRVTLLASTLHRLLAPVLPHTATGQDTAPLNAVRFEVLGNVLYLTGSDTHTLAVTRYPVDPTVDGAVTISRVDAAALLAVFVTSKLSDPELTRDIEERRLITSADDGDGTRVQHHAAPFDPAYPRWRDAMGSLIHRPQRAGASALLLQPELLGRFAKLGKQHRLRVLIGADPTAPLLVLAGDFFAAVWRPSQHLDTALEDWQDGLPWRKEFTDAGGQEVLDGMSTWAMEAAEDQGQLEDGDGEE